MTINVNKAVASIVQTNLVPGFYLGVKDKSVDKTSSAWRESLFPRSQDIQHDKEYMFWDEFREKYPMLMPTDVAPCETGDLISVNEAFERRFVTQGYWHAGFPINCDFTQYLRPGECPYTSPKFAVAIEDYFLKLREKLFMGFNQKEEYWSSLMATGGVLTIKPKGGKDFQVKFERSPDLNLTVERECTWCIDPKDFDGNTRPKARPWDDYKRMNDALWEKNRGGVTMFVGTKKTLDASLIVINEYISSLRDASTAQILFPNQIRNAGMDMPAEFDGQRLYYVVTIGTRIVPVYAMETTFTFCDDKGQEVCVDSMRDGVIYGFNQSIGNNTFGGRFSYGRIHNFFADDVEVPRFFSQEIALNGKSMKYWGESAPMALVECPDASVCMVVCPELYNAKAA